MITTCMPLQTKTINKTKVKVRAKAKAKPSSKQSGKPRARKPASRACDYCQYRKIGCKPGSNSSCFNCNSRDIACTYNNPTRRNKLFLENNWKFSLPLEASPPLSPSNSISNKDSTQLESCLIQRKEFKNDISDKEISQVLNYFKLFDFNPVGIDQLFTFPVITSPPTATEIESELHALLSDLLPESSLDSNDTTNIPKLIPSHSDDSSEMFDKDDLLQDLCSPSLDTLKSHLQPVISATKFTDLCDSLPSTVFRLLIHMFITNLGLREAQLQQEPLPSDNTIRHYYLAVELIPHVQLPDELAVDVLSLWDELSVLVFPFTLPLCMELDMAFI